MLITAAEGFHSASIIQKYQKIPLTSLATLGSAFATLPTAALVRIKKKID